jgi:diguanylate cyclase (GGDEF)-like protein
VPQSLVERTGAVSLVIEPVMAGDALRGALAVAWKERREEPRTRERALLRALAAEAATALERVQLLGMLRDVARLDPVTGVANRRAFEERLAAELARAGRSNAELSIILLDLDHFGAYNERHGVGAGDELLRVLAKAWHGPLRASDLIARIGPDEFGILLTDCPDEHVDHIAERLHHACGGMATFGAAVTAWDHRSTAAEMLAAAESALAQARSATA